MYKGALVLEGGAMRGVYTSGVLDKLMEKNIDIEAAYGISAGSKNGIYYVTKQDHDAIRMDLFCAGNKKAISVKNMVFKGGMINSHYYKDSLMTVYYPLDLDKFETSQNKFYIGATNCNTGECEFFLANKDNYKDCICASCSLPFVQSMIILNDTPYLDGGIADNIPYVKALEDGYEKRVIIVTRPKGYRTKKLSNKVVALIKKLYHNYPNLVKTMLSNAERYNNMMDEIDKLEEEGKVFVFRPTEYIPISRLEKDTKKLEALYMLGQSDCENRLDELIAYLEK